MENLSFGRRPLHVTTQDLCLQCYSWPPAARALPSNDSVAPALALVSSRHAMSRTAQSNMVFLVGHPSSLCCCTCAISMWFADSMSRFSPGCS